MDPGTFSSLKAQLNQPFFSNKKAALESFLPNYWFSGDQTAEIIGEFPHASEREEVLGLIAPRLTTLTGADAKKIVSAFTFAGGKLKAVELIASRINDPVGKYTVLDAIDFHFDKEKARKILDEAVPVASHTHHHHEPHHHHHHHHHHSTEPPPPQGPGTISVNLPGMQLPGFPQISFNATVPGTTAPPPASQYPGAPPMNTGYGGPPPATSGYPSQGVPPTGYPSQGAPTGYPSQGAPTGYPPQGGAPGGYPSQGVPPAGYPPQGAPPTGYPSQGAGYPPPGAPPTGYPYGYPQ